MSDKTVAAKLDELLLHHNTLLAGLGAPSCNICDTMPLMRRNSRRTMSPSSASWFFSSSRSTNVWTACKPFLISCAKPAESTPRFASCSRRCNFSADAGADCHAAVFFKSSVSLETLSIN